MSLISNKRKSLRLASVLFGLPCISQLQGCLMTGNAPSGGDMRLVYGGVVALALALLLWLVIRFMR
jgi:hypothetical protein